MLIGLVVFVASQVLIVAFNGEKVPVPNITRSLTLGKGAPLNYVVIGDSTAIGQGANYKDGVAYNSAEYLAQTHKVTLTNYGISGAVSSEVLDGQVDAAAKQKPDIALICLGANDVTHLSSLKSVEKSMTAIITSLQKSNKHIKIVLTGAPAMGVVPRFPFVVKFLAGIRTDQINKVIQKVADKKSVTRLKIAEITGPIFLKKPELFAEDNFHPNSKGYSVWTPIIIDAL